MSKNDIKQRDNNTRVLSVACAELEGTSEFSFSVYVLGVCALLSNIYSIHQSTNSDIVLLKYSMIAMTSIGVAIISRHVREKTYSDSSVSNGLISKEYADDTEAPAMWSVLGLGSLAFVVFIIFKLSYNGVPWQTSSQIVLVQLLGSLLISVMQRNQTHASKLKKKIQ